MMKVNILFIVLWILSVVFHEWGHILFMKSWGIFKGMKFHWLAIECVIDKEANLDIDKFDAGILYFSGFLFSFIMFLPWLIFGFNGWFFIVLQLVGAMSDFYMIVKLGLLRKSFREIEG